MTGLEYQRTVCPTTKVGKDPLREDVADAFDDGVAEGWKQCKEKQWKPSEEQMKAVEKALSLAKNCGEEYSFDLRKLLEQLKAL